METKVCINCNEEKPITDFGFNGGTKNAVRNRRKICNKCKSAKSYQQRASKLEVDEDFYWKEKVSSINKPNARRSVLSNEAVKKDKLDWKEIKNLFDSNPYCHYCSAPLDKKLCHLDHAYPLSRGGKNTIDNIHMSCKDCNYLKHTRTEEEFLQFMKEYVSRWTI